ncbi:nicotinate-nucleotide--dimethylbenzimidazole phosphoribosyltransferase [Treponema zioleckii]|uniref:nicotinate-nucleotide--dimethylbenzimidazole phosphoribosyltransferase n=1 Tax=Treponema zioleckii TaxID=331680 RepID=UPI00168B2E42|nr:nicotinate-nucleotide--dimethylbenzimidazole phosphoribosyltransferase [Treponema zioleckii]
MNFEEQLFTRIRSEKSIYSGNGKFYKLAFERWQSIAKPLGGLGEFEKAVCKIADAQNTKEPSIKKRALAIFCADNGIVAEGVSQTDSSVTKTVALNMTKGESSACKMAMYANCDFFVLDSGIKDSETSKESKEIVPTLKSGKLINYKIADGTKNFLHEDAMSREDCARAILNGISLADELKSLGYTLFSTGEMGIGNTTSSAAVVSCLLSMPAEKVTGKGAGLSDESLRHKIEVVKKSIENRKPNTNDVLDVLSKVGGFDIAQMCGFFLGGLFNNVPVIIDGFISAVAALCAVRLCPQVKKILLASHVSSEEAAKIILTELEATPVIHAGMHLGEGTGCMMLLPLLDMAFKIFYEMPTFSDIKIEAYKSL